MSTVSTFKEAVPKSHYNYNELLDPHIFRTSVSDVISISPDLLYGAMIKFVPSLPSNNRDLIHIYLRLLYIKRGLGPPVI